MLVFRYMQGHNLDITRKISDILTSKIGTVKTYIRTFVRYLVIKAWNLL